MTTYQYIGPLTGCTFRFPQPSVGQPAPSPISRLFYPGQEFSLEEDHPFVMTLVAMGRLVVVEEV